MSRFTVEKGVTMPSQETRLSLKDYGINVIQASLLSIPIVGASLEMLVFGAIAELRMKRVEETLREVGFALQEMKAEAHVQNNEDFANLLEGVIPGLGRSCSEEKRVAFRNLLINATQLMPGDPKWTEAELATSFINSVNEVGLSIIASLNSLGSQTRGTSYSIFLMQDEQFIVDSQHADLCRTSYDFDKDGRPFARFAFHDAVARYWIEELKHLGMVTYASRETVEYCDVRLTSNSGLLIEWALDQGERLWM